MAALTLIDTQIEDLKFLREHPAQISGDFCKLAWNFLSRGTNQKMYQSASQKLLVDAKQIQAVVESLANFFVEAGKNQLNEREFVETLMSLGLSEESCSIISSEYLNQKHVLKLSLPFAGVQHPNFKDLEWRLETQVSSKVLKNQILPRVVIKLQLEKSGETENFCLLSDLPNMIHMNQVIGQALRESRTQHSKRIQRAVT